MGEQAQRLVIAALALWPLSEVALVVWARARTQRSALERRSTAVMWLAFGLGIGSASAVKHFLPATALGLPPALAGYLAAALVLAGLVLRWTAIVTLGRLFSIDVGLQREHRLVRHGVYRTLRHPSYSGLLLCVGGVALAHDNWLSALLIITPALFAIVHRIGVEERALGVAFGERYAAYRARSWRLVPWLY